MNRALFEPIALVTPPLLIGLSLLSAVSLPQPWGARAGLDAPPPACAQVSYAPPETSSYALAKVGLPGGSSDWTQANAAARKAAADLGGRCR